LKALEQSYVGPIQTAQIEPPQARATKLRIAYLLSQYPAISHTFFLKEVIGLRTRGLHLETASINPPDRPADQLPPLEAAEARSTQYIKDGRTLASAFKVLATALTHPSVFLRGLSYIARMQKMTLRQRAFWLFYLAEAMLVGRWMKQRSLLHLHVHFGGPVASVGMLTSIAWRIPYSLTIHGPEELLDIEAYRLPEKIAQASFVFCISDFCRSQICQFSAPSMWARFKVIRLGVDPSILRPSLRSSEPMRIDPKGDPRQRRLELVCTGRLVAAKGHLILLQALAILHKRGVPIHATLIGAGPEKATLESFVATHNMQPVITFTSALSHSETLDILRKADIFALASFAEGIPVALMEAMSLGIPCISTTIAGIPELIRTGQDGLLVAPGNVSALADAIASLAAEPALRKRLGASGRQRILTDYNLPLNHEHLAMSLEDLVLSASASASH
jgi:colanic acid/amylovoran biosynthesis glycosyltransferase